MLVRLAAVTLSFGVVALALLFSSTAGRDAPVPVDKHWASHQDEMGIVWGDYVFVDEPVARLWLDGKAYGYRLWALRHPPAARRLESRG